MPQKYIKILTFLGLIAIVAVQSLWLVNTYHLIDGKIRQACSRLFPKSVLDEVADRLNQASNSEDAELTIHLEETANIEEASGPELVSRLIVAFNHYADSVYQSTFSASALDSIFTEALAGEGIYVQVHSQVLDSARSVNASSSLLSFLSSISKRSRFFWMKEKLRWSRPVSLIRIGRYAGRWEFR